MLLTFMCSKNKYRKHKWTQYPWLAIKPAFSSVSSWSKIRSECILMGDFDVFGTSGTATWNTDFLYIFFFYLAILMPNV